MPTAGQLFSMDAEFEMPFPHPLLRISDRLPPAAIPENDGAAAIFILGDRPLEIAIFKRMILGLDCQTFLTRHEARPLWNRPAFQHPILFETEIIMPPARIMFLDEIAVALRGPRPALGLRRLREIALLPVFLERHLAGLAGLAGGGRLLCPRLLRRCSRRGGFRRTGFRPGFLRCGLPS